MRSYWVLAAMLVGCGQPASAPRATPAPAPSLYTRLGGRPAIAKVVHELVANTTADPRIKFRFLDTDVANLERLLVELVCEATGGPCTYTGRDMKSSHASMDLVEPEYLALIDALLRALERAGVPAREQGELFDLLSPLEDEIVAPPARLRPVPAARLLPAQRIRLDDPQARALLAAAIEAARLGQRSYAEQLFSRAELIAGPRRLAGVAATFREGAPPRITTALKTLSRDTPPQPEGGDGDSEAEAPDTAPRRGSLAGKLVVDGKPPDGLGVVMLFPKQGGKRRTPKHRVIEQRGKQFAPRVTAVPVGSTVAFPNFDEVFHNVFSLSRSRAFDLGLYKSGEAREVTFDKPGIVRLGCNIHAYMSAYIVVVDAPHYVVTASDGSFELKRLAPGKYRLQAWTERSAKPASSEVEIRTGQNTTSLDVGGGAPPSTDKFGVSTQR
jgi:hemoglobin